VNTTTCRGIEPLKLAFPAQVTYSVNQVSIQFQLHKLMQEIAIGAQKVVKQPLNPVNGIEHQEGPKKKLRL
jgi:hypothetical protein